MMAVTRCPRCGNNIAPKKRFCADCGFPVWEVDRVSDNLINNPVPFQLSDEHRKIYAASMANAATGDSGKETTDNGTNKPPTGGPGKVFVFLGLIAAVALLAAGIFVWQIWKNKKNPEPPVQQPESTKTIENTEERNHFQAETARQTEETEQAATETEEIVTETEEAEQTITETELAIIETEETVTEIEETEPTIAETEEVDLTEPPVTEKRDIPEKITEQKFLVTVENGTGGGYYHSGEKVSITAEVPKGSGLEFSGWEITEGDALISDRMMEEAFFTMPKGNVSIIAVLSEIKYTVAVTNGEGGGDYSAGEKVTLTADEPKENQEFDGWKIKNGDIVLSDPASESVFFYMPRGDVEISAAYREKASLTVENGSADSTELYSSDTTTITANEAEDGYFFTGWTIEGDASVEDSQKEQTILTIGSGNVTVSAKYEAIPALKSGEDLHASFLELAGSESEVNYNNLDKKIERFCRSDTVPPEGIKTIDISEAGQAVQAWYDNADGTIYWYSDAKSIRLGNNQHGLFQYFAAIKEVDFTGIDTRNVTDMSYMFDSCGNLTSLDLSSFDTGNVTNMRGMFYECNSLTSLDLSNFDTGNVTDMGAMFHDCYSLTSLDLSNFDTRNVADMKLMFSLCSGLTSLDLSSFDTGNVTSMIDMFYGCSSLTSLDVSSFDTGNVTSMIDMFYGCSSLTELKTTDEKIKEVEQVVSETEKTATETEEIEQAAIPVLKSGEELHDTFLELADNNRNKEIKRFCRSDTLPSGGTKTIDISEAGQAVQAWYDDTDGTIYWYADVETVRLNENTRGLFKKFTSLKEADFNGIDTGNVTNMSGMFAKCSSLTSLELSSFDTGKVTDMGWMFSGCSSLISLDVSSFDTGNVTDMGWMFSGCSNLTSLDLSSFDTGKVTDMEAMFSGCSSLTSLDLSSFDTGKVTDMRSIFGDCSSLTSLELSSFDTGNVTDMGWMFSGCSNLTSLDLSSFDTGIVTDIHYMFNGCSNMTDLKVKDEKIIDEYLLK